MKSDDITRELEVAPRRSARRRRVGFISVLLVAAWLAWWFWPRHSPSASSAPVPVEAGHASQRDFPIHVDAVGTVQALNTVDVKVRVDGQLARIAFVEGQDVTAGQVLAQLDQGPLTALLRQAQAAQRKDQASLDNARRDAARFSQLVGIGAATSQSVDTAKAQVESLAATVAADAALVQSEQLQLGFTTLYAPFTGRVGMREAGLGAIVHPGDATGIVTVTQMEPISVLFSVPQDVLPDLLANQAKAALPVAVTSRSGGTALADGSLEFIDSAVDAGNGQIKLKASFVNHDRKLWPGQLVNARVLLRTDRQRLAVPARAIVNTQAGPQLYKVDAQGIARLQAVTVGATVDGMTEISRGVSAADLLVLNGQSRLNPGTRVATTLIAPTADDASDSAAAGALGDPS
ncbi:MAG: efflux RND transporter periplasmic adaptor subunit [Janthinobacterium lividum]